MDKRFMIISSIEILDIYGKLLNYPISSVFTEIEEEFLLTYIDKLKEIKINIGSQEIQIEKDIIKKLLSKKFEFKKCHATIYNELKFSSKDIIYDIIEQINFELDVWVSNFK